MNQDSLIQELKSTKEFFDRSTRPLTEEDSTFAPTPGMRSASQQVAHAAQTIDWFVEGAFRPEGFDLDFEAMETEVNKIQSLKQARDWLDRAFDRCIQTIGSKSIEELTAPLPEGPIMGGAPRLAIVGAIVDHTAHHRGALTVYSRLRDKVPPMPYMET
jgi:uncharacterized damage-inducible protein DinB